jgi:hypothetical protein
MIILINLAVIFLLLSNVTLAETTNFKQQILPIDCIYEVVDVGSQKLRYITPETCPIDPGPPVITVPPTDNITQGIEKNVKDNQNKPNISWSTKPNVQIQPDVLNNKLTFKEPESSNLNEGVIKGAIERKNIDYIIYLFIVFIMIVIILFYLRTKQKSTSPQ